MDDLRQRFEDEAGDGWSGDAVCISVELGNDLLARIAELEARLTHSPASDVGDSELADLVARINKVREGQLTGVACEHGWDTSVCPMRGCGDDEEELVTQLLAALTPTTLASADDGLCSRTLEEAAKLIDPPLMHRKGNVGLWRKRRAEMAAAIRKLKPKPEGEG